MKKSIILILTAALLLSMSAMVLGFASGSFEVGVEVHQFAILETPEDLYIGILDEDENTNEDSSQFRIRTNFGINLDVTSNGFEGLNEYIKYYVNDVEIVPGSEENGVLSVNAAQNEEHTFSVTFNEEAFMTGDWETVEARSFDDTVVLTISAP
ncbi:hypothetical protein [Natronospora cellulosivora (SeqCode)]